VDKNTVKNINYGIGLIEQQRRDEASNIFNTITRQANTIAPPWFYLGRILYEQEQSFTAETKFDLALEINPYYIAPRLFKFRILYDQENYDKLLSEVNEALLANKIWLYHFWRAKALFALGEYKAAIEEIEEQCLKINPFEPDEYYLLGDAYAAIKDFDSAEKAYTKTQEINPHDIDDRFNEKMKKLQELRNGK
jgi:tetratricopeptide (TPR) repeat protein